jgi:UDP-3-O-[3-hydroxymyristoyl] glucosamine N-acyltransferase
MILSGQQAAGSQQPEVTLRVRELAEWLGAEFEGDGEKQLEGVAPLEAAGAAELTFVSSRKAAQQAESSAAGCLIVPMDYENTGNRTAIRVDEPRTAFARAVSRLHPPPELVPGIHPTAVTAPDVEIGSGVAVGPMVSIGEGTRIGPASSIGPNCTIGRRVTLGEHCVLHSNVTIYDDVDIGSRVILHAGSVIGADGFGFVLEGERYQKFPQIGRVSIGDDVEIGANSCVDRAALGVTWIGEGTKLDNMVHVAHNCRIGRHVVVAAQTGFSGGVIVEDYVVIGGQVGIGDKARIESRAVLGSGCGVLSSKIVRRGQVVWGTPARPLREYLEVLANLGRLPNMRKELADLKRRLEKLEGK